MKRPTRNTARKPRPSLPQDVATQAELRGLTPLAYLLWVMNNPKSSQRRRDRAAVVCARYLHSRPVDSVGRKQELLAAAQEAGAAWANDLDVDWQQ